MAPGEGTKRTGETRFRTIGSVPKIHPTAVLEGDITLADDVEIGPHCVLNGSIRWSRTST